MCRCIDISLGMLVMSSLWKQSLLLSTPSPFLAPQPPTTTLSALSSSHLSDKRDYTAEKSMPGLKERSQAYKSFCIIWTDFRCL